METKWVDLHVHSTESDGTLTPEELITEAEHAGLAAIALTDHDTASGVAKASSLAAARGIELVAGIELSTQYTYGSNNKKEKEVHIVGLFIDPENELLKAKTAEFISSRQNRNAQIVKALQAEGFDITMEALCAENKDSVITRANIARFLHEHGMVKSRQEAFDKYIGDGCKCFVGRFKVTPMEAVSLIRQAGGVAILAHPILYHMSMQSLQQLIEELKAEGLCGIEALYSTYTPGEERLIREVAARNDLLISGGSDFHGSNKPTIHLGTGHGNLRIPYSVLQALKDAIPQG
jgi:hypothetical protein